MGVVIDKARRDDAARCIDRALGRGTVGFADPDDPAVLHGDIGTECRFARAIDHASILDQEIVCHAIPPFLPLRA